MTSKAEGNQFVGYVASDVLLSLQNPCTDATAEPAFLIMTQVSELLFKLAHIEASRARGLLDIDDVSGALWTLRRLRPVYAVLNSTWDALGSLSPVEYNQFRDQLGKASGFQSFIYRQNDFLLGNKNRAVANTYQDDEAIYRDIMNALTQPSLYDSVLRLLWRRGLPVPKNCIERDWSEPYVEQDAVVDAWRTIYADRDKHGDLYELAEALVCLAHDFARWRFSHLLTAERLLGSKTGTGGTAGVRWLRRVAEHRFFPELWTVRERL